MKKLLASFALMLCGVLGTQAQYYPLSVLYNPGNPGMINTDPDFDLSAFGPPAGSTTIIADIPKASSTPQYSASQAIPFAFKFNGGPVASFKANSSGYITFSKKAVLANAGNTPAALPSALLPDSTVCVWGLCLAGSASATCVYKKVYGVAPHRQLWIDWFAATNPTDTCAINWWGIVLEETTNNIYVVDQAGGWYWNGCASPINPGLTVGIQVDIANSYQIAASPNINALTSNQANVDNDYYEFDPGVQPTYDAAAVATNITNTQYYGVGMNYPVNGTIANHGSTNLTSYNLKWQVSGGPVQSTAVSSVNISSNPVGTNSSVGATWVPAAAGTYTMKIWADNLNGNADQNNSNDTLIITNIQVLTTVVAKMPLFEEFNQASCDPCAAATPNLDSVLYNNRNNCSAVRYHVSWPGRDEMNAATDGPFVSARVGYYAVGGVPDAKLDGSNDIYPGSVSSTDIQNEMAVGSPFQITINTSAYNTSNKTYALVATIKSFGNIPAGLSARVALTLDTITYSGNQSTESIPQYTFPQVAEDMLPSQTGTALGAFTPNSTQVVNVSWAKNHPWGLLHATWPYDSTLNHAHLVVWVQNNATKYVYQSANASVTNVTGLSEEVSKGEYMDVYPNPTSGDAYVSYNLTEAQNVNIEVYNMLGEKVYTSNEGKADIGMHTVTIAAKSLQAGVYFVRFSTEKGTTTKRLVIQ